MGKDKMEKPVYTKPTNKGKNELLAQKNEGALKGGGEDRIEAQHEKGK